MAIKTKYRMKTSSGAYETYHFETDANQVLTNSSRLFVNQVEKDKWNDKAESRHAHGAGDITALMSYTKPSTASAINNNDSLLTALGKLEKGLDGKQPSGSYASASHTHDYAPNNHTHSGYALTSHSHDYAASNHNHDAWYFGKNGGTINGSISGNADAIGEMHFKAQGNNIDAGLYLNQEGRIGMYDWKNGRGVFQYNANSGIMDFSPTCVFYGRMRTELGVYFDAGDSRICKYYTSYRFDIDGNWRNSQLEAGQIYIQPWSTEGTALCVNKDGERTNGRTDLTLVPSQNNYGIFGRSNRYWYIAWAAGWRNPSYRESKYDIMRTDENRLYNYVKDLNIYNYRRISGDPGEERKASDYRGDLQMGAMINELPFEVVDYDTEHGEGKGIDLYSYASMIGGALKVTINKLEKVEEENELLKNKLEDMEEKINGFIQQ